MKLYWLCDRSIEQKQFHIYWKRREKKLGNYPTKHHPAKYHRTFRHLYVANTATTFNESFATSINQLWSFCKGVINSNLQSKQVLQNIQTTI